jgi:NAD(P)-dependent dehydrogenase (short-subunit alcohol dehydrogenase family)
LEEQAKAKGLSVTPVELDVNSDEDVAAVVPELLARFGKIDALVNNAGYGLWGPLQGLSIEELKAQFETNVFAAFRMAKAVLPNMLVRRRGTIVNISSVAGRVATPFNGAYVSSKFALEGMSEALRHELRPHGVRVAVVEPGLFRTNFYEKSQVIGEGVSSPDLPYHQAMERYHRKHGNILRFSHDPITVAKVIHKVIRSHNPAFRYPVGIEAWLGIMGSRFVPSRIFQAMVRRSIM